MACQSEQTPSADLIDEVGRDPRPRPVCQKRPHGLQRVIGAIRCGPLAFAQLTSFGVLISVECSTRPTPKCVAAESPTVNRGW
jgi:hypothetical protein